MLYFLHGDRLEARKSLSKHIKSLKQKRPDAELFVVNKENISEATLAELTYGNGLFQKKYVVILDSLCEKKENEESLREYIEAIAKSEHIFLCIEESPGKKLVEDIQKIADKTWEFVVKVKPQLFNVFNLAERLGNKDKKSLWVLYMEALSHNISPEEIVGVLFWQVKNIIIAEKAKDIQGSKLSPFVYRNALKYETNFSDGEALNLANQLVEATNHVRRGEGEMEVLLERIILRL